MFQMKGFLIYLFAILSIFATASTNAYRGYKVYRLNPTTGDQFDFLLSLTNNEDLDFWIHPSKIGSSVDIMVKPADQESFVKSIFKNEINQEVLIEDVQSLIESQTIGNYGKTREMTWDQYYSLYDIYNWFVDIARANVGKVSMMNVGKSHEENPIFGLVIAHEPNLRQIVIEAGTHGREWISTAVVTGLVKELLNSTDPVFQKIAESFEWILFPSVNPDGYYYTHKSPDNRLWHKTRTPYGNCFGADPNKNWNVSWMEHGSSNIGCLDTYAGPKPFSEDETQYFSNYLIKTSAKMDVFISFRSYSQSFLIPYGYSLDHVDNYDDLMEIGTKVVEALKSRYGTNYRFGTVAETHGLLSGTSIDWVKKELGTPLVFGYELRDLGRYGYLLPPSEIIPNIEEVIDSLKVMLEEADKLGYVRLNNEK